MATAAAAFEEVWLDPVVAAKLAGLHYVTDAAPGIRRQRAGDDFRYVDPRGREVIDPDERLRIKALAIPPAWTDVWISADPRGHLQATGRDARGRKQYRYHNRWREVRDEAKFERLAAFAAALPFIRKQAEHDLRLPDLPKRKVLAALVELLEATLIRVGNDEYARQNASYGLTTLHEDHAQIRGSEVRFVFRGKSGKDHRIGLRDRRLAKVVKRCREIPGQRLFQYLDDEGQPHGIYSDDVNDYLREIGGQEFTAKDFRTWEATVLAAQALLEAGQFTSRAEAKRNVKHAIEAVSERLGNTPTVARKCYIHPELVQAYLDGTLAERLGPDGASEAGVLRLLQQVSSR